MAMVYVSKKKGQKDYAPVLKVVEGHSDVVGSLEWPRVTLGTPVEWMVEDQAGNARAVLEGLMDLWPRITMGTINTNQSDELVVHKAIATWPRYTLGTVYPGIGLDGVESETKQEAPDLADFLDVWPRITMASTVLAE